MPQQSKHHVDQNYSYFLPIYRELFNSPYIRLFIARLIRLQISTTNQCPEGISADYWGAVRWGNRLFGFNVYCNEFGSPLVDIYPIVGEAIQADTPLASALPLLLTSHVVTE